MALQEPTHTSELLWMVAWEWQARPTKPAASINSETALFIIEDFMGNPLLA
jgi:hypothetical protein